MPTFPRYYNALLTLKEPGLDTEIDGDQTWHRCKDTGICSV